VPVWEGSYAVTIGVVRLVVSLDNIHSAVFLVAATPGMMRRPVTGCVILLSLFVLARSRDDSSQVRTLTSQSLCKSADRPHTSSITAF